MQLSVSIDAMDLCYLQQIVTVQLSFPTKQFSAKHLPYRAIHKATVFLLFLWGFLTQKNQTKIRKCVMNTKSHLF